MWLLLVHSSDMGPKRIPFDKDNNLIDIISDTADSLVQEFYPPFPSWTNRF